MSAESFARSLFRFLTLMMLPSLASATASSSCVSLLTNFFINFFSVLLIFPSTAAVAAENKIKFIIIIREIAFSPSVVNTMICIHVDRYVCMQIYTRPCFCTNMDNFPCADSGIKKKNSLNLTGQCHHSEFLLISVSLGNSKRAGIMVYIIVTTTATV